MSNQLSISEFHEVTGVTLGSNDRATELSDYSIVSFFDRVIGGDLNQHLAVFT